jgi:arylsulfate sulfotransferase
MRKSAVKILLILSTLLIAFTVLFFNGFFIKPNLISNINAFAVIENDILKRQAQTEIEILMDYQRGFYTFENPYIINDPYDMNPLSALVIFQGEFESEIHIRVHGKDSINDITYYHPYKGDRYEIPIIGLYPGYDNLITITNNNNQSVNLNIKTDPLPLDFQDYHLITSNPAKMQPGLTLFSAVFDTSYTAFLDYYADVRGYFSYTNITHGNSIVFLDNGNLLVSGDELRQIPYNKLSLWEINFLGKIFKIYEIPHGVHHDISILPDGNILAAANNLKMFEQFTQEDVAIIIDRETGEIIKEYDYRQILDETREPYHNFHPPIKNAPMNDWMHMNGILYVETFNLLISSSPTQSHVVAIDATTQELKWILGDPTGYEGTSSYLKEFLLTPVGLPFEWPWGQHHPEVIEGLDENPNTIDLLLFDNGASRGFTFEESIPPSQNYSRAVIYRIDIVAMTVEQIWSYGENRLSNEVYSTYLGDANYDYQTGNVLVAFGGQLRENGIPVDTIIQGVIGEVVTHSRVVEVTKNLEVVFEVEVLSNAFNIDAETYQAKRFEMSFLSGMPYLLGTINGVRLGSTGYNVLNRDLNAPNLFFGPLDVEFNKLYTINKRLVVDGYLVQNGVSPLLGRGFVVLISSSETFIYNTNPSLNARFFASIDLSKLPTGTYKVAILGGTVEGNDTLGEQTPAFINTGFILTINND